MNLSEAYTAGPLSLPWIERLIRFDTTSFQSNLGLIETVRDYLQTHGLSSTLTYDPSGKKANLFATLPAADGTTQGGIVLSGHTDVVPVKGQTWDSDPFSPEIRDGKLFGRGTCDMKGFIGVALTLLPEMKAAKLKQPVHFAFSCDEELGCVGAPYMLADLKARGITASGCIVGEPTDMRVIVAHKGINAYRCRVHGHAAHSSLTPQGLNAIEYAARLICFIRDQADQFRADGPFDEAFDVPFTTLQTSIISGGNAINTIPANCEFSFEYRNLPGVDTGPIIARIKDYAANTLLPRMKKEHANANIDFELLASAPTFDASEQAAITQLVRALTHDQAIRKVAYGTEAGLFQALGIPSVVCGPGSIEQAHKANEYVTLEQLSQCESFMRKLIQSLAQAS
ncbi:acetylornithine deacetylase [Polaromonas sp. OV174]|uniref:acetylornithine deacetylase n=1 Tax=Polaromonas sp. OV174 TaxID=1855300 RepID=UPI0021006E5E|nr:acetylornithine deacetylase [Polaromonas sp. OV174]